MPRTPLRLPAAIWLPAPVKGTVVLVALVLGITVKAGAEAEVLGADERVTVCGAAVVEGQDSQTTVLPFNGVLPAAQV